MKSPISWVLLYRDTFAALILCESIKKNLLPKHHPLSFSKLLLNSLFKCSEDLTAVMSIVSQI